MLPGVITRGQRPFVFLFAALLVVLATMAATPAQRYLEAQERVESLTHLRDELAEDVDALEDRKERLNDPEELELIARRDLGLVEPGEIPYVVVRPDDDEPSVDVRDREPDTTDDPWWQRVAEALGLLGEADEAQ